MPPIFNRDISNKNLTNHIGSKARFSSVQRSYQKEVVSGKAKFIMDNFDV